MNHTDRTVRFIVITGLAILAILLAINIISFARSPTLSDLSERQERIESQLMYVSCLLLLEEQTPEAVAGCQVSPNG